MEPCPCGGGRLRSALEAARQRHPRRCCRRTGAHRHREGLRCTPLGRRHLAHGDGPWRRSSVGGLSVAVQYWRSIRAEFWNRSRHDVVLAGTPLPRGTHSHRLSLHVCTMVTGSRSLPQQVLGTTMQAACTFPNDASVVFASFGQPEWQLLQKLKEDSCASSGQGATKEDQRSCQ